MHTSVRVYDASAVFLEQQIRAHSLQSNDDPFIWREKEKFLCWQKLGWCEHRLVYTNGNLLNHVYTPVFLLSSLTNTKVNSDCKARYTGSLSFVFVCFGKQLQNNKSDKLNSFRLPRSSQRRVGSEGSCLARRLWDLPAQKGLSLPPLCSPTDTFKELDINFSN